MTRFRPCIDLHAGAVKQIVGGTLDCNSASSLKTNYTSTLPASHFATLYRENDLVGGHLIMLGPGNEEAAQEALAFWPGFLQVGGGITPKNATLWMDSGAEKVIVTSYLFPDAHFSQSRLDELLATLGGDKNKLVIDLSCRRQGEKWFVAMNKWQTITDMEVNEGMGSPLYPRLLQKGDFVDNLPAMADSLKQLEPYCSEFLIHAADNEGLQKGVDESLVKHLGQWCSIPVTYAGGGRTLMDLDKVKTLSGGKVDLTIGSALDIFGGKGVSFEDCVRWNMDNE